MENEEVKEVEVDEEWGLEAGPSPAQNLWTWVKNHGNTIVTVGCTILGFVGNCIFSAATKRGVDDYLYTTTEDDEIYRIPVKKMKKMETSKKELQKKKL